MRRRNFYLFCLLAVAVLTLGGNLSSHSKASATPDLMTGHFTLMGYEGIGTIGENLASFGRVPPVGDYVTTHCRYIDVTPLSLRESYLRYILHLPDGATLHQIDVHIADFAAVGSMGIELRSRPWNSRQAGTVLDSISTPSGAPGDLTLTISDLAVAVDNRTTQYWIDIYFNQQTIPGQLCVYAIRATYTYEGGFLPLIRKGG